MRSEPDRIYVGVTTVVEYHWHLLVGRKGRKSSMPGNTGFEGKIVTPGGRLNFGEKLADAAVRETYEETGVRVCEPKPWFVQEVSGLDAQYILHVFKASVTSQELGPDWPHEPLKAGDDLVEVLWADAAWLTRHYNELTPLTQQIIEKLWDAAL